MQIEEIGQQAAQAVAELLEHAKLRPHDLVVVGCSSSEVCGHKIGSDSNFEVAQAIFSAIHQALSEQNIYLAAQCCEHLNRALIVEREAAERYGLEQVNVVPQPKAGGSFGTAASQAFAHPVAVESLKGRARGGMDIGDTLIGMHLAQVAVPLRLSLKRIGQANLVCARVRPKFVGGERAHYNSELL